MTLALFLGLLVVFGSLVSMITEAIKKELDKAGRKYSSNFIVLCLSLVIGIGGTAIIYILYGIPFTLQNVTCLILMGIIVWFGSMIGYDKMVQLLGQIDRLFQK